MDGLLSEEKHDSEDTSSPTPRKTLPFAGSYTLIRKIQVGGQASIYLAAKEDRYFALKVYAEGEVQLKAYRNEVAMLQRLAWRGLVPIEETAEHVALQLEGDPPAAAHIIAMPFIENGDLFDWVCKHGVFTEFVARYFTKRLVGTLRYMQSQHVMHRDLKMENILLDVNFEPLLLDFGLSADSRHRVHNFVGDVRYAAPEVLKQLEHTHCSEIYSLGVLLFYLLTGHFPFLHARVSDPSYRLLLERKPQHFWEKAETRTKTSLSPSFKELFVSMVSPQPSNRPTYDELLEFAWFSEGEPTREEYRRSFESRLST